MRRACLSAPPGTLEVHATGGGGGARTLGYVSTKCFAKAMAYSSGLHRLEHCLAT